MRDGAFSYMQLNYVRYATPLIAPYQIYIFLM